MVEREPTSGERDALNAANQAGNTMKLELSGLRPKV